MVSTPSFPERVDAVALDVVAAHGARLASIHHDASGTCQGGHTHRRALMDLAAPIGRRR